MKYYKKEIRYEREYLLLDKGDIVKITTNDAFNLHECIWCIVVDNKKATEKIPYEKHVYIVRELSHPENIIKITPSQISSISPIYSFPNTKIEEVTARYTSPTDDSGMKGLQLNAKRN